jgi:hypothetical protein
MRSCYHWSVDLAYSGRTVTTTFYTGLGHVNKPPIGYLVHSEMVTLRDRQRFPDDRSVFGSLLRQAWYADKRAPISPNAADVLSCMVSDTNAGQQSFEEFCSDYGYDIDSRKAFKTWEACKDSALQCLKLLGTDFESFAQSEH